MQRASTRNVLLAAAMAALVIAPAASAATEVSIALRPYVCGLHAVKPGASVRIQAEALPLTVRVSHNGASADYNPSNPDQSFALDAFVGESADGAWIVQGINGPFRDFVVELHIKNGCGYDGASPGQGGPLACGGHPQVYVPTLIWDETTNTWLLQKPAMC